MNIVLPLNVNSKHKELIERVNRRTLARIAKLNEQEKGIPLATWVEPDRLDNDDWRYEQYAM